MWPSLTHSSTVRVEIERMLAALFLEMGWIAAVDMGHAHQDLHGRPVPSTYIDSECVLALTALADMGISICAVD